VTREQSRAVGITANVAVGLGALFIYTATKHWVRPQKDDEMYRTTFHGFWQVPGLLRCDQPDRMFDPKQLRTGIKVEMEHTTDPKTAKCIAKHHMAEEAEARGVALKKARYYTDLLAMEAKWKR
jgi:hypothetical protein